MNRNVEIKARVADAAAMRRRVAAIADRGPRILTQEDVFFACPAGRLKLRSFPDGHGEVIHYERPDSGAPKESAYVVVPTRDPGAMRALLATLRGIAGVVRKQRAVYGAGRTRIHLDAVEGLGDFVELEVVLSPGEPSDAGMREARRLMQQLCIEENALVPCAYIDLLRGPGGAACAGGGR